MTRVTRVTRTDRPAPTRPSGGPLHRLRGSRRATARTAARLRPLLRRADAYTLWAFNPPAHLGGRPEPIER